LPDRYPPKEGERASGADAEERWQGRERGEDHIKHARLSSSGAENQYISFDAHFIRHK
jgi:hypothetical protein